MLVSIVIPLFNEEEGVEALAVDLHAIQGDLEDAGHRIEIVFVDDGSTDGTSWQISLLYRGRTDARVVAHRENRGFGAAFRTGIAEARGAVILCCDGDRPYPPADAALLVEAVKGPEDADVATVSPWGSGGRSEGVSLLRRVMSRGASLLYRVALRGRGAGITCFTASYRAYKGDALRGIEFRSNDFLATAEILVRLLRQGRRVIEIPSTLTVRKIGSSKMRILRTVRRHLGLLSAAFFGRLDEDWKGDAGPDSAL